MEKLKDIAILCDDTEVVKDYWNDVHLGGMMVFNKNNEELDIFDMPYLEIGYTIILKAVPSITSKDIIKILKLNPDINAILVENTLSTFDDEYFFTDDLEILIDTIIESNEKYDLLDITIEAIAELLYEKGSDDEVFLEKVNKVYKICGDPKVYPEDIREMFIF